VVAQKAKNAIALKTSRPAFSLCRVQVISEGWDVAMRDWWLVLLPVMIVLYFVVFPDQFSTALHWLGGVVFK